MQRIGPETAFQELLRRVQENLSITGPGEDEIEESRRLAHASEILNKGFEMQLAILEAAKFMSMSSVQPSTWRDQFFPDRALFSLFSRMLDLKEGTYPFILAIPCHMLSLGTQMELLRQYHKLAHQHPFACLDRVDIGKRQKSGPYFLRNVSFVEFSIATPFRESHDRIVRNLRLSPLRLHEMTTLMLFAFEGSRFQRQYLRGKIAITGSHRQLRTNGYREIPTIGDRGVRCRWPVRFHSENTHPISNSIHDTYVIPCCESRVCI